MIRNQRHHPTKLCRTTSIKGSSKLAWTSGSRSAGRFIVIAALFLFLGFHDEPAPGESEPASTNTRADQADDSSSKHSADKLEIPFYVTGCDTSTDGKRLLVWGLDHKIAPKSPGGTIDQWPTESHVAIADLETGKIMAQRKLYAVGRAVLNAHGAYVAPLIPYYGNQPDKMQIDRLSPDDLRTQGAYAVATVRSGTSGTITSIADRFLICEPEGKPAARYSLPNLKPVEPIVPPNTSFENAPPSRRLADGWALDGSLWNDDLQSCKLLIAPLGFAPVSRPSSARVASPAFQPVLQGYVLDRLPGTGPRDVSADKQVFHVPHIPAQLDLEVKQGVLTLAFSDLVSHKTFRTIGLVKRPGLAFSGAAQVLTTPKFVLVRHAGEIFVAPAQAKDGPFPEPFRIEPRQELLVLPTNEPARVTYIAKEATTFELSIPSLNHADEKFVRESDSGTFEIDLSAAIGDFAENLTNRIVGTNQGADVATTRWKKYREISHAQFRRLVGKEPNGMPAVIHAYVKATNKDLVVAVLHHAYLIDLPASAFKQPPGTETKSEPDQAEPAACNQAAPVLDADAPAPAPVAFAELAIPATEAQAELSPGHLVKLHEPVAGIAFDHATGDLALTIRNSKSSKSTEPRNPRDPIPPGEPSKLYVYRARYFDGDASAVDGPIEVDENSPVAFKPFRDRTLLLVAESRQLMVLDASSLKPFDPKGLFPNPIELPDPTPGRPGAEPVVALSASRVPDDAMVLVSLGDPAYEYLVDLSNGADTVQIGVGSASEHPEMSPRGRLVFIDSGGAALRIPFSHQGSTPLPHIGGSGGSRGSRVADPFEQCGVGARGVCRLGSDLLLAEFKDTPLCILERRPFIVTRDATQLHFRGRENPEIVARVTMPKPLSGEEPKPEIVLGRSTWAFEDLRADRLLITRNDTAWVLPMSSVKLPDAPLLAAKISLPIAVTPGIPVSVPIEVPDKRVRVSLKEGPPGANLESERLSWTPDLSAMGLQKLTLGYEADGRKSEHHLWYLVADRGISLPIAAKNMELSDDGRFAAVWNFNRRFPDRTGGKTIPKLCTVDLKERRVLAERAFPRGIEWVSLTTDQVFVRSGPTTVEVLRLADLSLVRTLWLTMSNAGFWAHKDRVLVLSGSRTAALKLPDLSAPAPLLELLGSDVRPTLDGWVAGPAVLDEEMKNVKFFHSLGWRFGGVTALSGSNQDGGVGDKMLWTHRAPTPTDHVTVQDNQALRLNESQMVKITQSRARPDAGGIVYASVGLVLTRPDDRRPTTFTPPRAPSQAVPLMPPIGSGPNREFVLKAAGDTIAVIFGHGKLIPVSLTEFGSELLDTAPLVVQPEASNPIVLPGAKTQVQFKSSGGQPPYKFECSVRAGLMPDAAADIMEKGREPGEFVVDGARLVKELTDERFRPHAVFNAMAQRRDGSAAEVVDQNAARSNEFLEPVLGRKFDGVPAVIDLRVEVTDALGQQGHMTYQMILELPREKTVAIVGRAMEANKKTEGSNQKASPIAAFASKQLSPPRLPVFWPEQGLAVEVSNRIRENSPRADLPDDRIERLAAQFSVGQNFELRHDGGATDSRTWKLTNGRSVTGRLRHFGFGSMSVLAETGSQNIDTSDLTDESLDQAWRDAAEQHRKERNLTEISAAIHRFHDAFGCFPPQSLIDKDGKPLLSWRVLLLPYLGHSALFRLFHLDEPWDSPHNKRLISYLPQVYTTAEAPGESGRANVLLLTGPRAAFCVDRPRRIDDFRDGLHDTLFAVEVKPNAAVEWTKPVDLSVADDPSIFDQLIGRRRPNETDEIFQVVFGSGPAALPANSDREQILRAARIDDGQPSGLRGKN